MYGGKGGFSRGGLQLSPLLGSGLVLKTRKVGVDNFGRVLEFRDGEPGVLRVRVAHPFDEVLELASTGPMGDDGLDFVLVVVLDLERGGPGRVSAEELTWVSLEWLEEGDMEDRVPPAHGLGKLEAKGNRRDLFDDGEGTGELGGEFATWTTRILREPGGGEENLIARLDVDLSASLVGLSSLGSLGGLEVVLGGVEGSTDPLGEGGCGGVRGGLGREGYLRVTAVVKEEGRGLGRGMTGIVVGELGGGEESIPVALIVGNKGSKDLLESAVSALGLTIGLGMVGGGHA